MKRRFVFAGNNKNAFLCGVAIAQRGYLPELLLLHPPEEQQWGEEIISLFPHTPVKIWGGEWGKSMDILDNGSVEMLLSVGFGYIFPSHFLKFFRYPLNLHTGLLPFNKGSNPNVWAIYEGTPAGVTLHFMTSSIDNGEIVAQKEIYVSPTETGKSLYEKLEKESVALMKEVLPMIMEGEISSFPMPKGGTYHTLADFHRLCRIDEQEESETGIFLRRLRALSFPPYKNAFIIKEGQRYYIDIEMSTPRKNEHSD